MVMVIVKTQELGRWVLMPVCRWQSQRTEVCTRQRRFVLGLGMNMMVVVATGQEVGPFGMDLSVQRRDHA